MTIPLSIQRTGLVTSVGLTAEESCAAFRARIANPSDTRFIDAGGDWILAHQVLLEPPSRGLTKLARMAALAIAEVLQDFKPGEVSGLPLLLCVAEADRPGRTMGLDDTLLRQVQELVGARFAPESSVLAQGRVGVASALAQARQLVAERKVPQVLIAATDSFVSWTTLAHYEQRDRLLTPRNPNGFMPGEAAGAMLVGAPSGAAGELLCTGMGFAYEPAHVGTEEPLRADGLSQAFKTALAEAGREIHEMDYRVTDLSGEHYYFKEAALAVNRTLHRRKESFDLWHPAECTGEVGAVAGATIIAAVLAACRKKYSPGHRILAHMADDAGERAALTLEYVVPA